MSEFCIFVFCKNIKHHTNFPGSTYSKSDFVQYEPISIRCIFTTFQKHLSKSIFCFCRQAFFSWSRSLSIPRQHYVSRTLLQGRLIKRKMEKQEKCALLFWCAEKFLPLCWTSCAQDEILILPLWLIYSVSRPSANFWHRPQHRICCFTHIVYHVCICIFG